MSLFKTKEWWRTECGVNDTYDRRSLLVAPLFGSDTKDVIVVGSHGGYLRIYDPSSRWMEETKGTSGYKPTDLMIETQLADCIVDLKAGKFVSSSQDLRLAVLTPTKLIVYSAALVRGSIEHGDRCILSEVYEHALARFPASLTIGPFGGVREKDYFCVQYLDGTLQFFEQETRTFWHNPKSRRLLPTPLVYISRNDVFVTLSSGWILECYRYQNIAEFSGDEEEEEEKKKRLGNVGKNLEADWSYNLGEGILDIDAVTLSSFEVGIVVLTERNLYCLRDNCTLKFAKRFEYNALCFRPYVIEPDGKLMILVASDTSTLMVYEGTALRWSAQLPFVPVAVARVHLEHLDGAVVVLSEEGRLEVCYLGSEPSLFVAPPLHKRDSDYAKAEKDLLRLRKLLHKSSDEPLSNTTAETELNIAVSAYPHLESCGPSNEESNDDTEERRSICRITVELTPYAPLRDVQIFLDVRRPFELSKDSQAIPNLCDRHVLQTTIRVNGKLSPMSSEVRVTATYETGFGILRVQQKFAQIPLRMMVNVCPPENTASFVTTLKSLEPVVNFSQLFPAEFIGDYSTRQNANALGLQHVHSGSVVTIISGATSNRYRVQSNDGLAVALVVHQLVTRLKDRSSKSLTSSVGQNHLQLVGSQLEAHFATRQRVKRITNEIDLLTTQLRNIEKRMLCNLRERNSRPLTTLSTLLDATYRAMFTLLEDLTAARAERERAGHGLQCALRLLLLLLRLNVNDDKYVLLESAIGFEPQLRDDVDWEEVADVALVALLRATSRKTDDDASRIVTWNKLETPKDLIKLKKRIAHAVERLNKDSDVAENESG